MRITAAMRDKRPIVRLNAAISAISWPSKRQRTKTSLSGICPATDRRSRLASDLPLPASGRARLRQRAICIKTAELSAATRCRTLLRPSLVAAPLVMSHLV